MPSPLAKRLHHLFTAAAITLSATLPAAANENKSCPAPSGDTAGRAPAPAPAFQAASPPPAVDTTPRVVRLTGEIDDDLADRVNNALIALDSSSPGTPIQLRINSPGGEVVAGLRIFDTMKSLQSPVATVCEGRCMSMAAVLLIGGSPGMRSATPSAVIMIHELSGGMEGKYSQMKARQEYLDILEDMLVQIISDYSGIPKDKLAEKMRIDTFYRAGEAAKLGLIDRVQTPRQHAPKKTAPLILQQPVRRTR